MSKYLALKKLSEIREFYCLFRNFKTFTMMAKQMAAPRPKKEESSEILSSVETSKCYSAYGFLLDQSSTKFKQDTRPKEASMIFTEDFCDNDTEKSVATPHSKYFDRFTLPIFFNKREKTAVACKDPLLSFQF